LGLTVGAAKGDIKVTDKGAMIGEIAARLSGGFMSAYTYPLSTGVNLIKAAIKIALGESPKPSELKSKFSKVSVEQAIIPQPGSIINIKGINQAKKIPGIEEVFLNIKTGDIFKTPTSNVEKAGNVIGVGKNRKEALDVVNRALKIIKIEVGPVPTVTESDILNKAQRLFEGSCFACSVCDGLSCRGLLPGMGSAGTGATFINNIEAFKKYKININVIHNVLDPDLRTELFGYKLKFPVIAAPITGTDVNMNNAMDEFEYVKIIVDSFRNMGSIAMVGDGAKPDMYLTQLKALAEAGGWGIPIFKPRLLIDEIMKRLDAAQECKAMAAGIDIDAVVFKTMKMENQPTGPLNIEKLKKIIKNTKIPFIIKGVMTREDALKAMEAGARAIVISNHGGRVLDHMPSTIDVLREIVEAVKGKMLILIDGGIRTGLDVFKSIALGADAVLIGRPVTVYAVGGRQEGVKLYLERIIQELRDAMILTGAKNIRSIKPHMVRI
ncbi:MAG: alpha-hydroxy-acid oxidizing protein, partial [Spirochaetes bacterium]|nr:alpha-hydroxy-acid oxidizing protein [Spirochaetota bacterium]